ncbi:MAG: YCF48-related protein [Actinomycetota bacterium]|nr:YCF48-related protein [Actinomycetota bacterium]
MTPTRPVQAPQERAPTQASRLGRLVALVGLIAFVAAGVLVYAATRSDKTSPASDATGLPDTPDYHSLLVGPTSRDITLGTHYGLYQSSDGGRHWKEEGLSGQDAMNLARGESQVVWEAGHNLLAKSTDRGQTWNDVRPAGLPSLDLHGFAVDARNRSILYAAVAGIGLYGSRDGGASFTAQSRDVGGAVMALAATPDGTLLAGDMQQGLLARNEHSAQWKRVLGAQVMGLAVNPARPRQILAGGTGGIFLSSDGGKHWRRTQAISDGAGPVAWSSQQPNIAYAVGLDRELYTSNDAGETWTVVT